MSAKNIAIIRNAQAYDFGGGERFPIFLAEVLKGEGFNPTVISRSAKLREFANEHSIHNIRGWWWKKQSWSGPWVLATPVYIVWQIVLYFYYLALFRKLKTTVVHIQSKDDFISATLAARTLGLCIIWTDHADLKHIWRNITVWYKNPIGKMIYRAARFAHAVTVVSESELYLVSKNLPKSSSVRKKLSVVYNGAFDASGEYPHKKRAGINFSFAGRLVRDKGVRELIEAFDSISKKYNDTQLTIIGDGPDAGYFKKLAKSNNSITFLGYQSNPFTYLSQSDIFVLPTYHEGFSLALVEASMLNLAIIATDVGGNPEIIKDNKTGLLISPKDSSDLADKMEVLISNTALRKEITKNARQQFVDKFQFDVIVKKSFIPLFEGEK